MPNNRWLFSLILTCGVATAVAADTPLSAIDWLSEAIVDTDRPANEASDITDNASVQDITVKPLDAVNLDSVGLFPASKLQLSSNFWGNSETSEILVQIRNAELISAFPALSDFVKSILLSEAQAPINSDGSIFLARVDALLALGDLDAATALLQASNIEKPELFRRWFDISLLTGTESNACDSLRKNGEYAPTYQARIFCLARNGDWTAAALTLNSAETLNVITTDEYDLIARFLDPDLYEGDPLPTTSGTPSPLIFRMFEAIGEPFSTKELPRAFAHADLRPISGWKARLEASERLARVGALPSERLLATYLERSPAASGGVWDRVRHVHTLNTALKSVDPDRVSVLLPAAYQAMSEAGLGYPFADLYAGQLNELSLTGPAQSIAYRLALMSDKIGTDNIRLPDQASPFDVFLKATIDGNPNSVAPISDPRVQAVRDGFSSSQLAMVYRLLLHEGRTAEALLLAAHEFNSGRDGDLELITRALRLFRHVGQHELAQRIAVQYLIMEQSS